jgi:hypothetical protein
MAVMVLLSWKGVGVEQYNAIRAEVNLEANPPPGGQFHVVAATPDGLRITDVWDSPENFNAFVGTRLMPAVQKLGIATQPTVEILPAHAVYQPR